MKAQDRLQIVGQSNPAVVELARRVSLATRIEPLLLRRARLHFMPRSHAGVEADLWFSHLVETRGSRSILLYPDVADTLRTSLVQDRTELNEAWQLLQKAHAHLPALVRLEEEITWLALTGNTRAIDEKLKPIVKDLVGNKLLGMGRWAVTVLPRLPLLARTTEIADILLKAAEVHLYNSFVNVEDKDAWVVSDALKALVLQNLERVRVGVRLYGNVLEASEPPLDGDETIEVPATNPRVLEVEWESEDRQRKANLIWRSNGKGAVEGVSVPTTVRTFAGERHEVRSRRSVFESLNQKAKSYLVTILTDDEQELGVGWLVNDQYVLTGEDNLAEIVRARWNRIFVRFPFLGTSRRLRAEIIETASKSGQAQEIHRIEGLILLEVKDPLPEGARPAPLNLRYAPSNQTLVACGHSDFAMNMRWSRFVEERPSLVDGSYELKPVIEAEYAEHGVWSGSPLLSREDDSVVGMHCIMELEDGAHPLMLTIDALSSLFPVAFIKPQTIFIGHSHADRDWKDRLLRYLGLIAHQPAIVAFDDRDIAEGADWLRGLRSGLAEAGLVILLISDVSLTSSSFLDEEVSKLLQRYHKEGLSILPVIIEPCDWQSVAWLRTMNVRPMDGRPLSTLSISQMDSELAAVVAEVQRLLGSAAPEADSLRSDAISIGRLPVIGRDLFGRERELKLMDEAWASRQTNILSLVGWGGGGKSALVSYWLRRMAQDNYRGAEKVYAWSFYQQGVSDRVVSADQFIDSALRWFGDPDPTAGSPWDKGERLAGLINRQRTLLILDGLESLQLPPGPNEGELRDPILQALLSQLAAFNEGLCIITTRLAVTHLGQYESGAAVTRLNLESLSPSAGAEVLKAQGVKGTQAELEQASQEFSGHPLSLMLLGNYLKEALGGDIGRRSELRMLEEDVRLGSHARSVMASYESWFGEGPELAILRMLGLFNCPADEHAIEALRAMPVITGLTDTLQNLSEADYQRVLSRLRRSNLLVEADPQRPGTLDTHPLVREHFGQQLKRERPEAWRAGNDRLYEHFKRTTKEFPETLEEMSPLYKAVIHGAEALRYQEALDQVYFNRIQRGETRFNHRILGAFGQDLSVISTFFKQPGWVPVAELDAGSKSFILNIAGFDLRAQGRLLEAMEPARASLEAELSRESWENAAAVSSNLSQLSLTMGVLPQALTYARQAIELADRGGSSVQQTTSRAAQGDALLQAGRLAEAEGMFVEAEKLQQKFQPRFPYLHSHHGFKYSELLIELRRYAEAEQRAFRALDQVRNQRVLLDVALNDLVLGVISLHRHGREPTGNLEEASSYLGRAVAGLRQAGQLDYLPYGLLAQAELYLAKAEFARAAANLDESMKISTRGSMRLHQADAHLLYARLYLAQNQREIAQSSLAAARELIESTGYHRRDAALWEIERALDPSSSVPEPARQRLPVDTSLLLLQINRTRQEKAFLDAFARHQKSGLRQPFVCVIHGEESARVDLFAERLRRITLPRIQGPNAKPPQYIQLWFPTAGRRPDIQEFLLGRLGETLLNKRRALRAEIMRVIAQLDSPLLIELTLSTADWDKRREQEVNDFIRFWSRWSLPQPAQITIASILLIHEDAPNLRQPARSTGRTNKAEVLNFLKNLEFRKFPALGGVVLPELTLVTKKDALDFINKHANVWTNQTRTMFEVDKLFRGTSQISMALLVAELKSSFE